MYTDPGLFEVHGPYMRYLASTPHLGSTENYKSVLDILGEHNRKREEEEQAKVEGGKGGEGGNKGKGDG